MGLIIGVCLTLPALERGFILLGLQSKPGSLGGILAS